jgi:YidC/Oxa1 family membrane protein insertase
MDFITIPFMNALVWIYHFLGDNFGFAIIVFTLLTRLVLYPFSRSQMKSSQAMQELQQDPEWVKIQKKHKNDKQKLQEEQAKFYKEKGINPLGSCLPTLLQFPIIIGMYTAISRVMAATPLQLVQLATSISLPNAASLIPLNSSFLWITDLSQPERLFLPFLPQFGIPLLAIIVFVSQFFMNKLITPPTSNPDDASAQMSKSMGLMMPLFIAYLAYAYSAGLALYFVTSNLATILQYVLSGKIKLGKNKEA